jgi:diacylglycerol kinase (ATP)
MKPYLQKRRSAFGYAFAGIGEAWRREAHLRIHAAATTMVIVCGLHFNIPAWQWVAVSICCALVIILELINTGIEKLCDLVSRENHPEIKYIKDISAAAVFIACLVSVIVALVVFGPRFAEGWMRD